MAEATEVAGDVAGDAASQVAGVLGALSHPNRLRLFQALRVQERCVRDLEAAAGLTQPLVSHHLGVLVRAGLVRARRDDGFTMYSVDATTLASARDATAELLDPEALGPLARPGGNPNCCRDEGTC